MIGAMNAEREERTVAVPRAISKKLEKTSSC